MRISEYMWALLMALGGLLFVRAVLPSSFPKRVRTIFSIVVAVLFFPAMGAYWLTTGEKPDEFVYRMVLCPIYDFPRCTSHADPAAEQVGRRQVEGGPPAVAAVKRPQESEAERRRQEKREREANVARQREEARQREAEAQRLRKSELRSIPYGATAIGWSGARGWSAHTSPDHPRMADAESNALAICNQKATRCKIGARFVGAGTCAFVAHGWSTNGEEGWTTAGSEAEALQICLSEWPECNVFSGVCNSP